MKSWIKYFLILLDTQNTLKNKPIDIWQHFYFLFLLQSSA